jgi:hypothetical protein
MTNPLPQKPATHFLSRLTQQTDTEKIRRRRRGGGKRMNTREDVIGCKRHMMKLNVLWLVGISAEAYLGLRLSTSQSLYCIKFSGFDMGKTPAHHINSRH